MKEFDLKEYLRNNNLKYTKTRQAIFDFLRRTSSHPTAEDVFNEVKRKLPGISYATVYNALNLFSEQGLIKVVSTLEDKKHFDGNLSPHLHLICLECGKIEDLPYEDQSLVRKLQETGWLFRDTAINIYGICPSCRKKKSIRFN